MVIGVTAVAAVGGAAALYKQQQQGLHGDVLRLQSELREERAQREGLGWKLNDIH